MENKVKMAVISGASEALKLKQKNLSDEEIMKEVTKNADKIAGKIDNLDEVA